MPTYSPLAAPTGATTEQAAIIINSDGTLATWGVTSGSIRPAPALTGVLSVAAEWGYALALTDTGTVYAWGTPGFWAGQTDVPPGLADVVYVAAGYTHCIAVKSDGTAVGWGANYDGETTIPPGLSDAVMAACAQSVTWILRSDGTVLEFGDPNVPMPTGIADLQQISGGTKHCLGLKHDGTVVAWGQDSDGETFIPPGLSGVIMVAAGRKFSLALKSDGTIVHFGALTFSAGASTVPPSGLTDVVSIYTDGDSVIAVKSDGSIVTWGEITAPVGIDALIQKSLITAIDVQITATVPITFAGAVIIDWTATIDPAMSQEIYTLTVTGAADGVADITIPVSSWQATNRAAPRQSYVQAVVPAAGQYLPAIEDRPSADLVIRQGYRFADGTVRTQEIVRSRLDSVRYDEGPTNGTLTLSGYKPGANINNGIRVLQGIRSISMTSGRYRVRGKTDLFLQPGMQVVANGKTFTVSYINYYANRNDRFCEVSDE